MKEGRNDDSGSAPAWEALTPGQALPSLTYELSLLRLVAFVRATGLYDYVHFDADYARSVGARDAFASTPHLAGLLQRLLTDWAGPLTRLRQLSFKMGAPSCRGETIAVTGRVLRAYRGTGSEPLVDVEVRLGTETGQAAIEGRATLEWAPADGAAAIAGGALEGIASEPRRSDEVPEFARSLLRKPVKSRRKSVPLTADEFHLWCECLEDWNPLYWNRDFAQRHGFKDVVCPPVAMFFGVGSSAASGVGYSKPGEQVPDAVTAGLRGQELLLALRQGMLAVNTPVVIAEFPQVVVVSSTGDYFRPAYPGDRLWMTQELIDCSPLRRTRLGEGHFFTRLERTCNDRGELIKTDTKVVFHYRPSAP